MDTFTCWNILKTVHTRYFFCVLYTFARASKDHKNTLQKCGFLRTDAFLIWSLFSVIKTISTQEVSGSGDKPGSFLQASHFCIGVEGLLVHHHHCEITKCLWERSQRVIWEQLSATVLQGLCCPTGSAGKGRWRGQHRGEASPSNLWWVSACRVLQPQQYCFFKSKKADWCLSGGSGGGSEFQWAWLLHSDPGTKCVFMVCIMLH